MKSSLEDFFNQLKTMDPDNFMGLVESVVDEKDIEVMAKFIEEFYEITDEDQVDMLIQFIIIGILSAKKQ